jgi:hypothetical protein
MYLDLGSDSKVSRQYYTRQKLISLDKFMEIADEAEEWLRAKSELTSAAKRKLCQDTPIIAANEVDDL